MILLEKELGGVNLSNILFGIIKWKNKYFSMEHKEEMMGNKHHNGKNTSAE